MSAAPALLSVRDLKTHFFTHRGTAKAVDGLSFDVQAGETVALVGESGCGKTVAALSILRLIPSPPGRIVGGEVLLEGRDLLTLGDEDLRTIRGDRVAMIFQEPMTSLNPVLTLGDQLAETLEHHGKARGRAAWRRAIELLDLVRIPDPQRRVHAYPHQMSGGMRQRVMIAMALACGPRLLIADEPTTALDVTVQAQILVLLRRLQREFRMAVLLITHDLGVVAHMAERVVVMYAGRKAEEAPVDDLFARPQHPYTRGLLRATPNPRREEGYERERLQEIPGVVASSAALPGGCYFAPRCPQAITRCQDEFPAMRAAGARRVACHVADLSQPGGEPPDSGAGH